MGIEKGRSWGQVVEIRHDIPSFGGELELAEFLSSGSEVSTDGVSLVAGDFVELTGGPHNDPRTMRRYTCDLLEFKIHGEHLRHGLTIGTLEMTVRSSWNKICYVAVTNLGRTRNMTIAHRSHPNDGKFEILDTRDGLSLRDYLGLRHRLRRGGEFNHPAVRRSTSSAFTWADVPLRVRIDGGPMISCERIEVNMLADALVVYVGSIRRPDGLNS